MSETLKTRIQERLEQLGKTPRAVSLAIGPSPDAVRNILRGKSESPRADTLERLAAALETTPQWLMGSDNSPTAPRREVRASNSALPSRVDLPADIPVMGTVAGSLAQGAFQMEGGVIDYVRRPPALSGARDIYAVFVEGMSMEPEHRHGDLRFVNPHRPPRIGDSIIVQSRKHENSPIEATIGHLQKITAEWIQLGKLNPPESKVHIARSTVVAVHKVMTMNDLFGV